MSTRFGQRRFASITIAIALFLLSCGGGGSDPVGQNQNDDPENNHNQPTPNKNQPTPNANNEDPALTFEAYFTQPEPGGEDDTIVQTIIDLLDQAPQGSKVRAAVYTFSHESIAEAFGEARERGVDIELVLGNSSTTYDGTDWPTVDLLRDLMGDRLFICRDGDDEGGCIGENIHHNKFLTFSELDDGAQDVVVQTSGNFTYAQLEEIDNLVVIGGDTALYEAFVSYWKDVRHAQPDPEYNRIEYGDHGTKAYFFPHSKGDPIVDNLERVDCETGADVYLAMAFFTNARSEVAAELRSLDDRGCGVHVVLREDDHTNSPGAHVDADLRRGTIDYAVFPIDAPINLHSKYLVVDGAFGDDGDHQSIVWTGSHNYTLSALRYNDEVILEIEDPDITDAFIDDWHQIRDRAHSVN